MATRELHRGRLIDHIVLVVRNLAASKAFYGAVFGALNILVNAPIVQATTRRLCWTRMATILKPYFTASPIGVRPRCELFVESGG